MKGDMATLNPAKVRLSVALALEHLNPLIPLVLNYWRGSW